MKTNRRINRQSPAAAKAGKSRWLLKLVAVGLLLCGMYFGVSYLIGFARTLFPVKEVIFSGNRRLTGNELKVMMDLKGSESLVGLSGSELSAKLLKSPWVRTVSFRKDFPDRFIVRIEEAAPFALLEMKGRTFFVDDKGNLLEEIKGEAIPFLPIISGDPFKSKDAFLEAINLVKAMKQKGVTNIKDRIEIIVPRFGGAENISMQIDGTLIKVGQGEYEEKLARLLELEDEIIRRGIPVDYIDLRFANKVVVKPINEVVK